MARRLQQHENTELDPPGFLHKDYNHLVRPQPFVFVFLLDAVSLELSICVCVCVCVCVCGGSCCCWILLISLSVARGIIEGEQARFKYWRIPGSRLGNNQSSASSPVPDCTQHVYDGFQPTYGLEHNVSG